MSKLNVSLASMGCVKDSVYPGERVYMLIQEAEKQPTTEVGRFRAMDCHTDIMDLCDGNSFVHNAVHNLGMRERIWENQERLGIV